MRQLLTPSVKRKEQSERSEVSQQEGGTQHSLTHRWQARLFLREHFRLTSLEGATSSSPEAGRVGDLRPLGRGAAQEKEHGASLTAKR